MQYPYKLSEFIPVSITLDEDGDVHAIYELSAPKNWVFREYIEGLEVAEVMHSVRKVRVYLCVDLGANRLIATVIPFDESGREAPMSSIHFEETVSMVGVLARMGFVPDLSHN